MVSGEWCRAPEDFQSLLTTHYSPLTIRYSLFDREVRHAIHGDRALPQPGRTGDLSPAARARPHDARGADLREQLGRGRPGPLLSADGNGRRDLVPALDLRLVGSDGVRSRAGDAGSGDCRGARRAIGLRITKKNSAVQATTALGRGALMTA